MYLSGERKSDMQASEATSPTKVVSNVMLYNTDRQLEEGEAGF